MCAAGSIQFGMGILEEILEGKCDEVARLRDPARLDATARALAAASPPRDFAGAVRRADQRLAVIAEIKRRSPSKGPLALDLDVAALAKSYEAGGAAALSVLTDERWFGGSKADLTAARAATDLPILRKDFVIDAAQVDETRALGADAILLVARALRGDLLAGLHARAISLGLAALVEVHDETEVERALAVGATLIGVNSRDLRTFAEDLSTAERLVTLIPSDVICVAESAVRGAGDAERMAQAGCDAVLVGEALVRSVDPESLVRALGAARCSPRR